MKLLAVTLLALVAVASAKHMHISLEDVMDLENNFAYGYLNRVSIPLADKIRKAEEEGNQVSSRIIGGSLAFLGQFPYQVSTVFLLCVKISYDVDKWAQTMANINKTKIQINDYDYDSCDYVR